MVLLTLEEDIIIARYQKGMKMDMDIAQQVILDRKKLQKEGHSNPLLVYINSVISESKSVRKFMAEEGMEGISCAAFVVKNKALEIFLNFFLKMDSPKNPIRVFYNDKEARAWLQSIKDSL